MTTLRTAARSLRRSPAFTALTVATLALGIGATTATFTVLDQVILRPLPGVHTQDRLVLVWGNHAARVFPHYPILWEAYQRVQGDSRVLEGVAATDKGGVSELLLDDNGALTPVRVGRTLGDFFAVLGVAPARGRVLDLADEAPGAGRVLVVSHGFWQRRWGGDPAAVGSTLRLDGTDFTVVGVLPEGFDYPQGAEVWAPMLPFNPRIGDSDAPYVELDLLGRLAAGSTPADAAREIDAFFRTAPELAAPYDGVTAVVQTFPDVILGDLRPTLLLLFGGALLVLAVALVNVSNLIFVRTTGREVAQAVLRSLGADSLRLARESLAEALLLGGLAGLFGGVLAAGALRWVLPLAPTGLARLDDVVLDWTTLGAVGGLTVLLIAVLALVPTAVGSRRPAPNLRRGRGSVGGHTFVRRVLLTAQAALALWAVAAAVLMVRTLSNLYALDLGFDDEALLAVQLDHGYGVGQVPEAYPLALAEVISRLEASPSIRGATAVLSAPLAGSSLDAVLRLERQTREDSRRDNPFLNTELVLPQYFESLRVPVLRGRTFPEDIGPDSPLEVVVNEAAARALWPGEDAVGQRVEAFGSASAEKWWTVAGVVADMRYRTLLEPRLSAYFPLRQLPLVAPRYLLVRTAEPAELLPLVSAAFAEADPSVRVVGASAVRSVLDVPLARPRLSLAVMGAFGVTVLLLAGVGVYGVMAASVRSRLGEVGVRMACGASPGRVGAMIVQQGMTFALLGVLAGLAAALATARLLEGLLFGVTPADAESLAAACVLVVVVAAAACVPPSLRAARTDPVQVLREE